VSCYLLTEGGEMVDTGTQTPRGGESAKQDDEVKVDDDEANGVVPDNTEQDNKEGNLFLYYYATLPCKQNKTHVRAHRIIQ